VNRTKGPKTDEICSIPPYQDKVKHQSPISWFDQLAIGNYRTLMITKLGSRQFGWMFGLVRVLFACTLFIASITPSWALAQSTDDPWAEPLNLSHSGVAVKPSIVIDSDGVVHAIWQDDVENYVYTHFDGDQWSAPETTNLDLLFFWPGPITMETPLVIYTGPNPLFIAGPDRHIFAFWLSPQGGLFTSKVENPDFADVGAWTYLRLISPQAASFAAAVDTTGEWHLAYLRTVDDPENPPGIYYTRSKNSGQNWTVPVLLYASPYFRTLGEGEANLSLVTAGTEDALSVYIAWDNRPRKQVLLAQSADGGETWGQPALVAGPALESGLGGPFSIHVGATQKSVVLVWQSGQPGGSCSQIFQSSSDAGTTWSDPQPMIEGLLGCAESNEFVTGLANSPEGLLYFLTETESQVFLSAWNGRQWSQPQAQPILSGFEEPEIYTEVIYGCHQASLLGERLYIVGCDQGGGGDVWVTSRDLGSNTTWFSSPVWSQPSPVTDENFEIEAIELVATGDDLIHAFFSQRQDPAIYYTYWDGELWSHITPVLKLPDGEAGWPAIAAGPGNELFLIALNNRGALYFSRATSGNAATESRWSTPTQLGISHDGMIGSVDVAWDAAGTVYVAYSVPVNEERGIYLVQSKDHGTSWSEPLQVFNGAEAGFDLVGAPALLTSKNGFLHIVWKQQSIQGDGVPQPLSLYYTRSEDNGRTFSDAALVVEEPVTWQDLVADGKGNIHLLWQGQDTITTVWDQVSLDGGNSWQFAQGLPDKGRLAAVTRDSVGKLHLVGGGLGALDHWVWDGSRWRSEAPLQWSLASQPEGQVELLAAAVNKQGKMMVVLAEPTGEGNLAVRTLLYSTRTLKLAPKQTAIQEVPTQTTLAPTFTPVVTPTPERSSTPASTVESEPANSQGQTDSNETNNRISPITMALLPVALLLLSVLGIVFRQAARVKDQ
jgi:hypothetical protein